MESRIDFSLYLITDRHSLPTGRSLEEAVHRALDGGVRAIQLREKDLPDADFAHLAERLRRLTDDYQAKLLLNDRVELVQSLGADGVHLGGHSRSTDIARAQLGPQPLIGVSTHDLDAIATAARLGADFVTFGPVYHTPSKAPYGSPVGIDALQQACHQSTVPVFALGGVTSHRLQELEPTGITGVALIAAIQNAADPAIAAETFLRQLS